MSDDLMLDFMIFKNGNSRIDVLKKRNENSLHMS